MSPLDEIRSARVELGAAGIDSAHSDAEWLMAYILGVEPGRLLLVDHIDDADRARFRAAVARRAQRIPLQHIVGRVGFGPIELAVGPGVFVPRPETEAMLEWAVAQAPSADSWRVADLCSGSGALALGLAAMVPSARVVAVELDDDALIWLRRNVSDSGLGDRVSVCAADVTDAGQMASILEESAFDIIVSNPPYVPLDAAVSPEVAHDPARAVFGGADGMSVISSMLPVIARALVPGGVTAVEHDDTTSDLVVEEMRAIGAFTDIRAHRDLTGRPRFVTARRRPEGVAAHARMDG